MKLAEAYALSVCLLKGEVVMACNSDYGSPKELKMGKKVSLKKREGLYVFEKLTFWNRLKDWIKGSSKSY